MFQPSYSDKFLIVLVLEGFLYGLYSGIFVMYLQYQASRKDTNKSQNIIFYLICAVYVLSAAAFVCDIAGGTSKIVQLAALGKLLYSLLHIAFVQSISFGFCDFIAQSILIYRCWIVWGRNIRVVIIPSILAFAFLATWLASGLSEYIFSGKLVYPHWEFSTIMSSITLSLTVNALVTGLIVFRILKVFCEVKATLDDQILGAAGGSKLQRTIFILVESGMALFSIQLARLVITIIEWGASIDLVAQVIITTHQMLNGITPTIILVRISMGLSFHEEKSMEEVAIETLRFSPNHPNPVPETGSVSIVNQDSRVNDDIDEVQGSNDVNIVERWT